MAEPQPRSRRPGEAAPAALAAQNHRGDVRLAIRPRRRRARVHRGRRPGRCRRADRRAPVPGVRAELLREAVRRQGSRREGGVGGDVQRRGGEERGYVHDSQI